MNYLEDFYHGIPPQHKWNTDETMGQFSGGRKNDRRKFLYLRTNKTCNRLGSDNLQMATVIECISAAGVICPPSFIFTPGPTPVPNCADDVGLCVFTCFQSILKSHLHFTDIISDRIATSENGWIDQELFQVWVSDWFIPFAYEHRVCDDKPIVLFVDGHESHETISLRRMVYNASDSLNVEIIIVCFPSKCTHMLQPLDVHVYNKVKSSWLKHCGTLTAANKVQISRYNFIDEYMQSGHKVINRELCTKAFELTGLHPVNPNVFSDKSFAPSESTSCQSHLLSSCPDDVPSSDPAIPSDAEDFSDSEDNEDYTDHESEEDIEMGESCAEEDIGESGSTDVVIHGTEPLTSFSHSSIAQTPPTSAVSLLFFTPQTPSPNRSFSSVSLLSPSGPPGHSPGSNTTPRVDKPIIDHTDSPTPGIAVDPGKMLFSASDNGTIRLWDLKLRICVWQFVGHTVPAPVFGQYLLSDSHEVSHTAEHRHSF